MNWNLIFKNERIEFETRFINDLARATKKVEQKYCAWSYRDTLLQKSERVFSYELFHRFREIINCNRHYEHLRLDGEINKSLIIESLENCGSNLTNLQSFFSPDLVLHIGQQSREQLDQILIVEIKTKRVDSNDIKDTIVKLNHYLRVLNFQYGVFISVNTNFTNLCNQIKNCFPSPIGEEWEGRFKRILLYNYESQILTVKRLYDLWE